MINRCVLVGRLTKDPELRYTSSNIAYTRFTIAVNRTFTGPNGEREADFIQCIAWRKQAENVARFVHKGSLVGVEGRIQTGSYDDKETGIRKYTTDIVCDSVQFLEPKGTDTSEYEPQDQPQYDNNDRYRQDQQQERRQNTPRIDVSEDDLPF
ncbi:single-stranded DNA-binding protein [Candidatus Xianfuyuplasma coldseepsis]|uniref:Single-stranded DNA-binding protein n=1 Tax=Candidatus Xianfuyuplasma coldseepsis TaxID=2782163 RepID=A0A7L7KRD7_9MOLU|nr:single-stranded DNA-binding protein [Xianfuyuplasma coldseepsis]QMS85390.1 single-stranded DNA-binding protein [Xianfuyuplasma coldseepsis]